MSRTRNRGAWLIAGLLGTTAAFALAQTAELRPNPAHGARPPHGRDDGRKGQGVRRRRGGVPGRRRAMGGLVDPGALQRMVAQQVFNLDDAPTAMVLENLRFQANPERARGKQMTVGYEFTDTGESFTLVLRNSVLEITPSLADGTATVIQLTRAFGNRILRGEATLQSGIDSGAITVRGNPDEVQLLHAVFDRPEELPTPNIAVR